ncbi:hypothetical protein BXZ70DRAFT_937191 [Cristinia sonorae]|uniref:Uncharacterized protein n=1 Tax=Cristinia sonorae TaxID=1940300 RepID=A0A8K0URI9_9AGAR|nr:hypothetical protein BXZ70DRAFT_937191 [Cristinia sonorae]
MIDRYTVPILMLLLCAFVLLVLTTFSVPFIKPFYFFHSDVNGGVAYGTWGWCFDLSGVCSPKRFGWMWKPQFVPLLNQLLVLYPIATGLTLICILVLMPVMCSRHSRLHPFPLLALFCLLAWLCSTAAFAASLTNWLIARQHFTQDGLDTHLGPLVWVSLGAMVALLIVAVNTSCGSLCRGHMGRRHSGIYFTY